VERQIAEGIGIHNPDFPPELKSESGRRGAAVTNSKPRNMKSKKWWILDPKGNWYVIQNMSAFCREHGLDDRYMKYQASEEREILRGGWNCRRFRETDPQEGGLPPFAL
jgi:hypothetical protein